MKRLTHHAIGVLFALAFSSAAWAQQPQSDLEVTLQVVPPGSSADAATGQIKLPEAVPADSPAHDASKFGLDTANQARERGRDFGQSVSGAASTGRERPSFTLPKPAGK